MPPVALGPNQPATFYRGSGRLAAFRGMDLEPRPEDWVASTTTRYGQAGSGLSVLPDGTFLADAVAAEPLAWLGPAHVALHGTDPALLVKLLDAGQRLPVHVHPDRPFALAHLASPYGKTEAWIVLDAAPGASVHLGFTRDVAAGELAAWVSAQDVAALLGATNRVPVHAGDAILCPAGLPLEEALACVDRRACSPGRLAELSRRLPGSLLPAEAGQFFTAESVTGEVLSAGFAV